MEIAIKHGHNAQNAKKIVWKTWCWSTFKGRSISMWKYSQVVELVHKGLQLEIQISLENVAKVIVVNKLVTKSQKL
jgi:hypothetical protein